MTEQDARAIFEKIKKIAISAMTEAGTQGGDNISTAGGMFSAIASICVCAQAGIDKGDASIPRSDDPITFVIRHDS